MRTFEKTRAALEVYDAGKDDRANLWQEATDADDIHYAEVQDKLAADLVRAAFLEDTKDSNSSHNANLIHPDEPWLRILLGMAR